MGSQISANYENIEGATSMGLWTIHSAQHKVSKEKVALWVIDQPKLKEKYKKKAVRFRYLDVVLLSLQQMRKYRHPRILKVLEIAEKKPEIGFSSEPFDCCVAAQVHDMHPMDVAYISFQISEVLSFLASEARIAHLCLNPTAVLMDDQLSVKLTQFQWSSPISSAGSVQLIPQYDALQEFSEISTKPPEMIGRAEKAKAADFKADVTAEADVFLFGLFLFEAFTGKKFYDSADPDSILTTLTSRWSQIEAESKIPVDFVPLVKSCLAPDPSHRPTILNVVQNQAFQSMQLKALRYIDIMLTKNPSDKFAFYKGLSKKIEDFSPSLQRIKLLPTLVNECIADVRFAPILIGPIFQISVKFTIDEFMELVWRKLSVLSTVVNPAEVSIGLLRNLWVLMEKVDKRLHKDFVYPIIFSALNSQDPRIHNEVLKQMDRVIEEMSEDNLRSLILPRLFDLAQNSTKSSVTAASILCISKSLKRMDNDTFATDFVPKLLMIWRKFNSPEVGGPILDVFVNVKTGLDIQMVKILPIACEIAGSNSLDIELRAKYCNYIVKAAQDFRDAGENVDRNFNENDKHSVTSDDNPFAPKPASFETGGVRTTQSHSTDTVMSNSSNSFHVKDTPNPFASTANEDDADDIFGSSKSSTKTNSGKTVSEDFTADSVFGNREVKAPVQHTASQDSFNKPPQAPASSSRPFTEDIFKNKAFQETADDIFGAPSSSTQAPAVVHQEPKPKPPIPSQSSPFGAPKPTNSPFQSSNSTTPSSSTSRYTPPTSNPSASNIATSNPPYKPSQPSSNSTFGYNTSSKPFQQNSGSSNIDIFGPSSSSSISQKPPQATTGSSSFGGGGGNSSASFSGSGNTFGGALGSPTAADIFGSSFTKSTSVDNYFDSFGTKQLGSGGFGDYGAPIPAPRPQQQPQPSPLSGFGANSSSITSSSPVVSSSSSNKPSFGAPEPSFNPFQAGAAAVSISSSSNEGKYNPFQNSSGGNAGMAPGMTQSGRLARTVEPNPKRPIQFGQIRPQQQQVGRPGGTPTSKSNDLLDLF